MFRINVEIKFMNYLYSGHPTSEQLEKLNQFKPIGHDPYTSEELIVQPILVSNNLIHHCNGVWSVGSLERMTASYAQGGQDFLLDHDWENTAKSQGFIFDAQLWHYPNPSSKLLNYLLKKSPKPDIDLQIIREQGYHQVICYAAFEASHPMTSEIRFNRKIDVSIGGSEKSIYLCPICSKEQSKPVQFRDESCPHFIPSPLFMSFAAIEFDENDRKRIAPYYIRDGFIKSVELSSVVAGGCPQAMVINEHLANLLVN